MIAPQTNMTIVRPNGIADQKISSQKFPSMGRGRSSSERRRYLTAKTKMAKKISATKKNNASTRDAMVDACSGNKGKPRFIALRALSGLQPSDFHPAGA